MESGYREYAFEYYHDGKLWDLTIAARSEEDAIARTKQIYYARLLGIEVMEIPASLGLLARGLCWLRNFLFS